MRLPPGTANADDRAELGSTMFERYDRAVECKDGHLFTTIWMPLVSFKAVRLGDRRYQRCPVGRHWTTVVPLDVSGGRQEDYDAAARVHDVGIP